MTRRPPCIYYALDRQPHWQPSKQPRHYIMPGYSKTNQPTRKPIDHNRHTALPVQQYQYLPTNQPTNQPTSQPTIQPTNQPANLPSNRPQLIWTPHVYISLIFTAVSRHYYELLCYDMLLAVSPHPYPTHNLTRPDLCPVY